MAIQIEGIAENFVLAEGPYWEEETQSLYFVDIRGHSINRYVPATKKLTTAVTDAHVSLIIPIRGQKDTFLITRERELRVITWDGETDHFSVLKSIETGSSVNFNDGKCDPTGRLWTGTASLKESGGVDEEISSFYCIEKDKISIVADKITVSNGVAFNTELKKLYYIDSHKKTVDEFDFDIERGTISNRQPIFTLPIHDIPGVPDGMSIDTDGNLWVAVFNGARVIKINPRRPETLLYTLQLPAKQVTSVVFGGKNLNELYVTSARIRIENLLLPENGALYRVTGLGARGFPGESFVL